MGSLISFLQSSHFACQRHSSCGGLCTNQACPHATACLAFCSPEQERPCVWFSCMCACVSMCVHSLGNVTFLGSPFFCSVFTSDRVKVLPLFFGRFLFCAVFTHSKLCSVFLIVAFREVWSSQCHQDHREWKESTVCTGAVTVRVICMCTAFNIFLLRVDNSNSLVNSYSLVYMQV